MKRPIPACSGLFLCASLLAQGSMTTPPGGLAIEGVSSSYVMGAWPDLRIQQADDVHSNGKPRTITEIAFRLDYHDHTARSATGRTWTNITLEMSEPMNFDNMSSIFSSIVMLFFEVSILTITSIGTSGPRLSSSHW